MPTHREPTWKAEFQAVFRLLCTKRIVSLLPAFFIS